eukprot:3811752-Pleurochrysis_carterae.AAC.1
MRPSHSVRSRRRPSCRLRTFAGRTKGARWTECVRIAQSAAPRPPIWVMRCARPKSGGGARARHSAQPIAPRYPIQAVRCARATRGRGAAGRRVTSRPFARQTAWCAQVVWVGGTRERPVAPLPPSNAARCARAAGSGRLR